MLLLALGFLAGGIGALAGIGGGIIITPVLAIYLGVPMHQAIGVSLMAVIATSTATSSVYVERGLSNIRLGMTLEMATTLGAAIAAIVAGYIDRRTLAVMFSVFMIYTASSMVKKAWGTRNEKIETGVPEYEIRRYPVGLGASLVAGGGLGGGGGGGGGGSKESRLCVLWGGRWRGGAGEKNRIGGGGGGRPRGQS